MDNIGERLCRSLAFSEPEALVTDNDDDNGLHLWSLTMAVI
jgi:hypothetical protein